MDIRLDYFWYEVPEGSAERLQDAAQQLEVCVLRLRSVLSRLERAVEEDIEWDNAASKMDDLQYHGETFLTSIYEFRERLIFLLAVLTKRDKDTLIGRGGYQRRQDALKELRKTMRTAADDIQALENQIYSAIRRRGTMTHEAFVHLAMFVEGQGPYEPDNALVDLKSQNEASYSAHRDALNKAIHRFVDERKGDFERKPTPRA
jgi:hypothetical protein